MDLSALHVVPLRKTTQVQVVSDITLFQQILWGSVFLGICLVVQTMFLVLGFELLKTMSRRMGRKDGVVANLVNIWVSLGVIVLGLTTQVWIWSIFWMIEGVFTDWNTAIYFSLVTYTALGYGDIVLTEEFRLFASFAAVTGLLGFGVSGAFLVSVLGRMLGFLPTKHDY